jgi:formate dehydrogenase maturation protein FdhE
MTAIDFTQRQDFLLRRYHGQMQDHHYSQLQSHRNSNTNIPLQPVVSNQFLPQQQQQFNAQVALAAHQQLAHLNLAVAVSDTPHTARRPIRRHEERKHECPTCGKKFLRPSALRTHNHTHTGVRFYPCPFEDCERHVQGKWFSVLSNKTRHLHGRHRGVTPPPYPEGFIVGEHVTWPDPEPEQEGEEMQVVEGQE